jgi:hypothetical protein
VEAPFQLLLGDYGPLVEPVLAGPAPERPGEDAGLQRGDARLAVELGAPRFLVGGDQEAQAAAADLVARSRPLARAPVREVEGKPTAGVERIPVERVLELELVRDGAAV